MVIAGKHFCVGVNPYSFIKNTKRLPVLTAAAVTKFIYTAFVRIRQIDAPVVCVAHGTIVGGGFAAMLNSDYRILVDDKGTVLTYGNLPRGKARARFAVLDIPTIAFTAAQYTTVEGETAPIVFRRHGSVERESIVTYAVIEDAGVVASDYSANFTGVCPGVMLSANLPRMVGETNAFGAYLQVSHLVTVHVIYSPRLRSTVRLQDANFAPQQAVSMGLVNETAPTHAAAMERALSLARQWAASPRMGVVNTLNLMRPDSSLLKDGRLDSEALGIARCNVEGGAFGKGWQDRQPAPTPIAAATPDVAHAMAKELSSARQTIAALTAQLAEAQEALASVQHSAPVSPTGDTSMHPALDGDFGILAMELCELL